MTFQIITDVTADLDEKLISKNQLVELDMKISIDGVNYSTSGINRLTTAQLLEKINQGKRAVTSVIGVSETQDIFTKFAKEGKEIFYLAFSSALSESFESACIARDLVLETYLDAKITIIDSLAVASGEGYLLEQVVKLRDEGKTVPEILAILNDLIPRLKSRFMVDDLSFLAQSGRISKATALAGTIANIKPVLTIDASGYLQPTLKARGSKNAVKALVNYALEDIDRNYPRIILAYSGSDDTALSAKKELTEALSDVEVELRPLGPVITAHTGVGALAVFFIGKTTRS